MGWFSPIKGHYPSLGQIDATLPVATTATGIERGMIIEMTTSGTFNIPTTVTTANEGLLYISLQDYSDAQAGMAGTVGMDATVDGHTYKGITYPAVVAGTPTITGLSLSMDGEYETSEYQGGAVKTGDTGYVEAGDLTSCSVGQALTVKNGFLSKGTVGTDVIVGYLTAPVYSRWVNNAESKRDGKQVVRQGKNVTVIRFRTK